MERPTKAEELVMQILQEKIKIEQQQKRPRVVLVGREAYYELNKEWLGEVKDLPWGDSLAQEIEQRVEQGRDMFLGDGTLLGLWVVRVETIEGFEVR
jgi:hypothetical protein